MFNSKTAQSEGQESASNKHQIQAPAINLPKGGGAVRGIGEKFSANPVTGTGSMTVPIATSPGRSGFGPQLSLSYDSGVGNGPFGFGWNLSLPSITRKTDRGIPQYVDAEESDVFILSGAEDLVPVYRKDPDKTWLAAHPAFHKDSDGWVRDKTGNLVLHEDDLDGYCVRRYRPRIEGSFARIERWSKADEPANVHWRSISRDNILTIYGLDKNSRIFDPVDEKHIFSWLICETRDDKGNGILYRYKEEDSAGVDLTQANERNRLRSANRYLKRVHYGNRTSLLNAGRRPRFLAKEQMDPSGWMFEVVFDYGEHDLKVPHATEDSSVAWPSRIDPFSTYRSGFEVRTYRLCRRVLMFHHIPKQASGNEGYDGLVRSTGLDYSCQHDFTTAAKPIYSFLRSATQTGYAPDGKGGYNPKSLPPLEFTYTEPAVQDMVEVVDVSFLENLPAGLDDNIYQWTDLHGEGIPGILTEQGGAWFYKRNISPIPVQVGSDREEVKARFAPVETVACKPNVSLAGGAQFMDLAGDGQPDLVLLTDPTPGLYEHDDQEGWQPFRSLPSSLRRDTRDPNLKFVDLNGDGHADVLITEDDALWWHPSLGEEGFGAGRRIPHELDEEQGPRLVFADGTQSIYLADLSGDGLTDLARIRNGEICYWPNLGYGRFGAKVTMDNPPWFDDSDHFDQKRIRLADIDGSGTTDIIYLCRDGVRLYFNQSGNAWSAPHLLDLFPHVDDLVSMVPVDLLGNGTACLVWSSALPGDVGRQMLYVDLMGGGKPHLLVNTVNNLGATTAINYAPSTKFYLQDKEAGRPWITRLPYPVHCVEKVSVHDQWRNTTFTTTYSYHHGYFDPVEREFRGFARVEQVDAEDYGVFLKGNEKSPYITKEKELYQPPVKTVTWYHTGAWLPGKDSLSLFKDEYYPVSGFTEHLLSEPDLAGAGLTAEEMREALRACKGMVLRAEVFELDVDSLASGTQVPVKLFTTAFHNCDVRMLQPMGGNRHGVFHAVESEAITYHYDLDLRLSPPKPDPRIAHTLNLMIDQYGNVQQSAAAVYRRREPFTDSDLKIEDVTLINELQGKVHLAYTENRYTDDDVNDYDNHRVPALCQSRNHEVAGIKPYGEYFSLAQLQGYALSSIYPGSSAIPVTTLQYHEQYDESKPEKRLVEETRTFFFSDDLKDPLPLGKLNRLGLSFETYKLALTDTLLDDIFAEQGINKFDTAFGAKPTPRERLQDPSISGYLSGAALAARLSDDVAGQYWISSGVAGFAEAVPPFYIPDRYTDPFGNRTKLQFDEYYLFLQSTTDAAGNTVSVDDFDFRVVAPRRIRDINDNLSELCFDILGRVTAIALEGKGGEADSLAGFDDAFANPDSDNVRNFFTGTYSEKDARDFLGTATARHLYYFGETHEDGKIKWAQHPSSACGIVREKHTDQQSLLQTTFEYSDGMGTVLVKKAQAEPEEGSSDARWIATGKTVLNNKGKPVKQYEPYFSATHCFEEPVETGVTPLMYYDAAGRVVLTELPDGSFSRVEFSPWQVTTYDPNDTVRDSDWYARRNPPNPDKALPTDPLTGAITVTANQRAAWLAAQHADTPSVTILDTLGREMVTIAHNKYKDSNGKAFDEKYVTFSKLDAEGKPLWIRDVRGNLVMQYIYPIKPDGDSGNDVPKKSVTCYDIAGNLLFQHSMDAGNRWMLNDASGKPMLAWEENNRCDDSGNEVDEKRVYFTSYDSLHRPLCQWLTVDDGAAQLIEQFIYGEILPDGTDPKTLNLRGQLNLHYDQSGMESVESYDFKGNPLEVRRRLTSCYKDEVVDWETDSEGKLEDETHIRITEYDALNRMSRLFNWHKGPESRAAVYEPTYNRRGLLAREDLFVRAIKKKEENEKGYEKDPETEFITALQAVTYNAKGQRESVRFGNGTTTRYEYDAETFRLKQLRTTRPDYDPTFPGNASSLNDDKVLQDLYYTYDPVGNIVEISDQAYETAFFKNQEVEPRCRYVYDSLYRLIKSSGREDYQATAPGQHEPDAYSVAFPVTASNPKALRNYTQHYSYDEVGNIKEIRHGANGGGWTRNYEYGDYSNRLLRAWEGDPDWNGSNATNKTSYRHDRCGNILNLADVAPAFYMRWDYRDMIHSLNLGGGGKVYYNYDSGKQRSRKVNAKDGVKQWERIYLGGLEIYRRYSNGAVVEEIETHHLFDGGNRALLVEDVLKTDNPKLPTGCLYRYQYVNHLGSAVLELNKNGEIISYEEYHPYGTTAFRAVSKDIKATAKRYRYTGKERDEESGLNYHQARYYAPWLGRWISTDPIGINAGLNDYCYVKNDPLGKVDPSGRQDCPPNSICQGSRYVLIDQGKILWMKPYWVILDTETKETHFFSRWPGEASTVEDPHLTWGRNPAGAVTTAVTRDPNKGEAAAAGWDAAGALGAAAAGAKAKAEQRSVSEDRFKGGVEFSSGAPHMAAPPRSSTPNSPSKPPSPPPPPPAALGKLMTKQQLIERAYEIFEQAARMYLEQKGVTPTEGAICGLKKEITIGVLQGKNAAGEVVTTVSVQDPKFESLVKPLLNATEEWVAPVVASKIGKSGQLNKTGYAAVHVEQNLAGDAVVDKGLTSAEVATSNPGCEQLCVPTLQANYPGVKHVNPAVNRAPVRINLAPLR